MSKTFLAEWRGKVVEAWPSGKNIVFQDVGAEGPPWRSLPEDQFWKFYTRLEKPTPAPPEPKQESLFG